MEHSFFALAFTAYTIAMTLYVGYALTRREALPSTGRTILAFAIVVHIVSLLVRTVHARQMPDHGWYVPWSNWFESFSFFTLIISLEFLIIQFLKPLPILGSFMMPLGWASLVMAVRSPYGTQIPILQPALQSLWMSIHVPVMFIAYAAFANSFGVGLAYLLQERFVKAKNTAAMFRLPPLDELDALIYRIIVFAFPVLTTGLLLGAAWAFRAWGRYWGWDPKETWALITWIVYAIYLYMRLVIGWRGRKTAYLSLFGFIVVLFTYVGVNYISSLHGFLSGVEK